MQKSMQAGKRHTNLRIRPRLSVGQIVLIVVLTLLAILMMTPFIWSVIASLTSRFDLEGQGFKFFYGHFTFENWASLFKNNWGVYIFNTLFIALYSFPIMIFTLSDTVYLLV